MWQVGTIGREFGGTAPAAAPVLPSAGIPSSTSGSGPSGAQILGGVSAGLDLLSGVFGYLAAQNATRIMSSRADMIRQEAQVNAQRYALQADRFRASQSTQYAASGVKLTGSPLDVLDETARVARENIAAIQRGGEARALDEETKGLNYGIAGRNSLIGGLMQGASTLIKTGAAQGRIDYATKVRNNTDTGFD
jgi:hypothetical protein